MNIIFNNEHTGLFSYYTNPTAKWDQLESFNISITLEDFYRSIGSSNLEFEKLSSNEYKYSSNQIPDDNIEIIFSSNIDADYNNILGVIVGLGLLFFAAAIAKIIFLPKRR